MSILFDRRTDDVIFSSSDPAEIWSDWHGEDERWLFVAPHDDDIMCGAGLTFLAAMENGIDTYAVVASNGRMGYCTPEQKADIVRIRAEETRESFAFIGLPPDRLVQLDYDDGSLVLFSGRRFADNPADPRAIAGAVGLQNSFTWLLRKIRPTRVFMANRLDLHPDHQVVNTELTISIFHAQGAIWPELGTPLDVVPVLYEYATYSDFAKKPNLRIRVSPEKAEKRLDALLLYKSQMQIESVVNEIRRAGGYEYLLERTFEVFSPDKYRTTF